MLKHMIFSDLYSFEGEHQISFQEGVNIIYGKNSAGKSNILSIIKLWKSAFIGNMEEVDLEYLLNKRSINKNFALGIMYEIFGEEWVYDFEYDVDKMEFKSETLYHKRKKVIEIENGEIISTTFSKAAKDALSGYNIKEKGFNAFMVQLNKECDGVEEIVRQHNFFSNNMNRKHILEKLENDDEAKNIIREEIASIDISVEDFRIIDRRDSVAKFIEHFEKNETDLKMIESIKNTIIPFDVEFIHEDFELPIELESDGTKQYFNMLIDQIIVKKYLDVEIFLKDELGNHLSDELLIKYTNFFNKQVQGQLIATTHNRIFLEKKLVDKSNIIFVDKIKDSSTLVKLSNYKGIRNDERQNWRKMYESGRFGAIANV